MRVHSVVVVGLAVTLGFGCKKESEVKKANALFSTIELTPRERGKLDIRDVGDTDVEVTGNVTGLKAGNYVVHLHTPKGCMFVGGDPYDAANHHADLGVITADESGTAKIAAKTRGRLGGMEPITGYCLVIYPPDLSTHVAHGKIYMGGFVGH